MKGDSLSVIARWTLHWCPDCEYGTTAPTDDHRCPRCRVVYPATFEVAPVNQPPGAVEALRDALGAVDDLLPAWLNRWDPDQSIIDQVEAWQERARTIVGGQ